MRRSLCLVAMLILAGCANRPPAPVADASRPVVVEGARRGVNAAPATAREGYYVVKKGDTFYRIAKLHGVDQQDLMSWNNIADPTKIEVGQELRVTLPEGAIEVKPIAGPAPIVVVSDSGSPSVATAAPHAVAIAAPAPAPAASGSASPAVAGTPTAAGVGAESVKREPRGGTVAYSDTALDQARAMEGSEAPARPAEQPAPAPTPAPPAASAAPAAVPAGDGVDWTWPVAGKVIGAFVDGGGSKESNKGIDLAGRMGEPIRAAASGTVTYVGSLRGYGDFLVVRHNARYISVYAHTSKIMVKTDQKVAKGQTIAEVGSSDSDRPKLHFEIRQDSSPVDPLGLLPARQ